MKAVRYDRFGGVDVLDVRDVDDPVPGPGEVLVAVRAAGINPGEAMIRSGAMAERFPSTFPSGQGSDLAGVVVAVGDRPSGAGGGSGAAGPGADGSGDGGGDGSGDGGGSVGAGGWVVGDEVVGWVDSRASHAELVAVPAGQLVRKPVGVDWAAAGGLFVAGTTAWAAVRAVDPRAGETVVVSGAAGGVGGLVVQLVAERGATVLGVAGPGNHDWLRAHGVVPVSYADGLDAVAARLRELAPDGVDAFVDTFGQGYVDLALALGVDPKRIDTVIDFAAVERHGVRGEGNADGANVPDLTELVTRLADGRLELPVTRRYPLADVRAAYTDLERRHTRGKIVLIP